MVEPIDRAPRSQREESSLFERWMGMSEDEWEALGDPDAQGDG
jgi:hypothetical protein